MTPPDPDAIRLGADILLLAGLIAGWMVWLRAARRQRRLEAMLREAAAELDAATRQLRDTAQLLQQAERNRDTEAKQAASDAPPAQKAAAKAASHIAAHAYRRHAAAPSSAPPAGQPAAGHAARPAATAPTEKILRMQREGASPEAIASALKLPLAQVRLIQKLHAATTTP